MHASDKQVLDLLTSCPEETIVQLAAFEQSWLSIDCKAFKYLDEPSKVPPAGTAERAQLASDLLKQLQYYGSNSIAYAGRKLATNDTPGVNYKLIVKDVCRTLHAQYLTSLKLSFHKRIPGVGKWFTTEEDKARVRQAIEFERNMRIPEAGLLEDYECFVTDTLLKIDAQGRTPKQVAEMFENCGLDKDKAMDAALRYLSNVTLDGLYTAVPAVVGKALCKEIVLKVIMDALAKTVGQEVAKKILMRITKTIPQKVFSRLVYGLGIAQFAWDTVALAGPATRVTIPCVALLAMTASASRREAGMS